MPGPTHPIHVEAISGWMPPWFHAKVEKGFAGGTKTQLSRLFPAQGVVDDAFRK